MGNPAPAAAASPTTSDDSRRAKLQAFVDWCAAHVTGDEKGQAQIYLDRLFQAFGQKGSLEVGGEPEMRIRKPKEDGGGTSFADYVWRPVVLIEMKRRRGGPVEAPRAGVRVLPPVRAEPAAVRRPVQLRRAVGLRLPHAVRHAAGKGGRRPPSSLASRFV